MGDCGGIRTKNMKGGHGEYSQVADGHIKEQQRTKSSAFHETMSLYYSPMSYPNQGVLSADAKLECTPGI